MYGNRSFSWWKSTLCHNEQRNGGALRGTARKYGRQWQLHANIREVFARRRGLLRQLVQERARGQSELERVLLSRVFSLKPWWWLLPTFPFPSGSSLLLTRSVRTARRHDYDRNQGESSVFRHLEFHWRGFFDWSTCASNISFRAGIKYSRPSQINMADFRFILFRIARRIRTFLSEFCSDRNIITRIDLF